MVAIVLVKYLGKTHSKNLITYPANFNFQFRGIFKKGEPVLEGVWEKVDGNGDQISIGPMGVFLTAGGKIRYKTNTHNRPGATGSWQDLAGGLTYISSGKLIFFSMKFPRLS